MNIILTIIALLYASVGIIGFVGYFPTVKDLVKKIPSANLNSYIVWTYSSCITFLYALLVVSDLLLEVVTGLNFLACVTILILAVGLKYGKY